jgi:hypothetical protein
VDRDGERLTPDELRSSRTAVICPTGKRGSAGRGESTAVKSSAPQWISKFQKENLRAKPCGEIADSHFAVIARSTCDEAIQLSVSLRQSWIASLRSQ